MAQKNGTTFVDALRLELRRRQDGMLPPSTRTPGGRNEVVGRLM